MGLKFMLLGILGAARVHYQADSSNDLIERLQHSDMPTCPRARKLFPSEILVQEK